MIGREQIREIYHVLSTNKLRTFLTGFSVGWGVLLLVILLSSGVGISNGITRNIASQGVDNTSVEIRFRSISIPYQGLQKWYYPRYTLDDCKLLASEFASPATLYAPFRRVWDNVMEVDGRKVDAPVVGVTAAYGRIRHLSYEVRGSRFVAPRDEEELSKVIVLNHVVAQELFGSVSQSLGRTIMVKQSAFTVIGVYKGNNGRWSDNYIPLSTQNILTQDGGQGEYLSGMVMLNPSVRTSDDEEDLHKRVTIAAARLKGFDPTDTNAIDVSSVASMLSSVDQLTSGLDLFLSLIGGSTLLIGIIGVVSIMQIAVSERRQEIGIRKALGAKPLDIISMILSEATLITLVAGLVGLMLGVGLMAGVSYLLQVFGIGNTTIDGQTAYLFVDPIITLEAAIVTLVVMLISGLVAGYLPARRAVQIPVVEAMRK